MFPWTRPSPAAPAVERERRRGNRLAAAWMARRRAAGPVPLHLPQPAPPEVLGHPAWRRFREVDLARRRPGVPFPELPEVPLPALSAVGRPWASAVRLTLHLRLEDELLGHPAAFAALEVAGLLDHARCALPEVLLEAGMVELPAEDLARLCVADEPFATVARVVLAVRGSPRADPWWVSVDAAAGRAP